MSSHPTSVRVAQLQFDDGASCKRWIQTLQLSNVQAAQQTLAAQAALLPASAIQPVEMLRVLEALREPVAYAQNEVARKYTASALPLESAAAGAWMRVLGLWQDMLGGYLRCHGAQVAGDRALEPYATLILKRCLQYTGRAMVEHHRIYRQVPAALWKQLHGLYHHAEQRGYARAAIDDGTGQMSTGTTCLAVYAAALLAQLANPFAMSARQMDFLARWIGKWCGLISLSTQPLPPASIPGVAIDLAGSNVPVLAEGLEQSASLRYLDFDELSRTLRQLITQLKQGQTPAQLGLGEDARQPGCENLLMLLYIQWCRAGTGRTQPREQSTEKARVCLGMNAAHFYISGRAFRAPGASLSRQEMHDMQLFGHISERTQRMLASPESSAVETWSLINHNSTGFLCMLREPEATMRISHHQLVAARRDSSARFYLGIVQWLRVEENKELHVGIRLFPGSARAVAVRPANFMMPGVSGYERGLLLPEVAALPLPATLILPSGWFQAGRTLEMHAEQKQTVRLVNLLEKGADFERCTLTPA